MVGRNPPPPLGIRVNNWKITHDLALFRSKNFDTEYLHDPLVLFLQIESMSQIDNPTMNRSFYEQTEDTLLKAYQSSYLNPSISA